MKQTKEQLSSLLDELEKITTTMDVPSHKRKSVSWLLKNMLVRNQAHLQIDRAIDICQMLLSHGITNG